MPSGSWLAELSRAGNQKLEPLLRVSSRRLPRLGTFLVERGIRYFAKKRLMEIVPQLLCWQSRELKTGYL